MKLVFALANKSLTRKAIKATVCYQVRDSERNMKEMTLIICGPDNFLQASAVKATFLRIR